MQGVLPNLFKLAPAAGISWFTFEVPCMINALNMGVCCVEVVA
jgi:hypothetical protein